MDEKRIEATLNAGDVWYAHGDRPDEDNRKVGVTVVLRKLPKGTFQVGIDTYLVEGVYGTDVSWDHHEFDTVSAALRFIEASTGILPEMLKRDTRPHKLSGRSEPPASG